MKLQQKAPFEKTGFWNRNYPVFSKKRDDEIATHDIAKPESIAKPEKVYQKWKKQYCRGTNGITEIARTHWVHH